MLYDTEISNAHSIVNNDAIRYFYVYTNLSGFVTLVLILAKISDNGACIYFMFLWIVYLKQKRLNQVIQRANSDRTYLRK